MNKNLHNISPFWIQGDYKHMRLVTRSDFDGLVCGVLLEEADVVDSHLYCHPKDIQDGKVEITANDVLANVPYAKGCGLWFDHHASNIDHAPKEFKGAAILAPSAARVIWDYYGGGIKFKHQFYELMHDVDKVDSAQLSREDILNPSGWVMLGFIMDPRTGLGRYHQFEISNYQLMQKMVSLIRQKSLDGIFEDPDVLPRLRLYYEHAPECISIIEENCEINDRVILFDTRNITEMPVGNRFIIYGLYPECNVSIQVGWGKNKENVFLSVGKSVLNRSNQVDIGALLWEYKGGGHQNVGTCQIPVNEVDKVLKQIIARLNQ